MPANLSGWTLSDADGTDTLRDAGMGLLAVPYQYVLVLDPDYIEEASTTYDSVASEDALIVTISSSSFGRQGLSNSSGEMVRLMNAAGVVIAEYTYSTGNSEGHSDEKLRLSAGDLAVNWADSDVLLGTPGFRNSVTPPDRDIALITCAAEPAFPPIGELFQLNARFTNRGLLATSNILRLSVDTTGGEAWVVVATRPIDALAPTDTSEMSWELMLGATGIARYLAEMTESDDDSTNNRLTRIVSSSVLAEGIVLNEIQAAPAVGRSEWVELTVAGVSPVSLSGVVFSDGQGIADTSKRHALPELVIAPGEYMIIAMDSSIFLEDMPSNTIVTVIADSPPTLNNTGDSLVVWGATGGILERVDYDDNWGDGEEGTSLERISLTADANDPVNWGSSFAASGSTPGRTNSRALNAPRRELKMSVSPSPFTPNNDGRNDVAEISYTLEVPAGSIDILVYDVRGRQVRRLAGGQSGQAEGTVLWDGRSDDGTLVPTGRYILVLEAGNDHGVTRERTTVILARPK
ncbi:MAG: lamin tail domain-containing protein [bacterium]|nr:lamin tail domain-containing protein [bacterium]